MTEILEKQREILAVEGLGALIAASPENVGYSVGYMIPSQVIPIRKRQFYSIVTPDKEALIVVNVEYKEALANSAIRDVREYNEFTEDPVDLVVEALKEFNVTDNRVGVELDFIPARSIDRLRTTLPKTEIIDAERIFDRMRMIKTPAEIETIREIARIVDQTHAEVYRNARPGITEMDIALMFIEGVLKRGASGMKNLVVGSGERSVFANCPPTNRVLRHGDVMRVDVFAHLNGYLSDIARTSVVGSPSKEQHQIWAKLCEAESLVFAMIKPGVTTAELWREFLDYFTKAELNPAINFLGHSIGLTLHEEPFIDRYNNYVVEEGMVLVIEPVFATGAEQYHLEDFVLVTKDGCEILSDGRGQLPVIM